MSKSQRDSNEISSKRSASRNGARDNSDSLEDIELTDVIDHVEEPREDILKSNATFHPAMDRLPKFVHHFFNELSIHLNIYFSLC